MIIDILKLEKEIANLIDSYKKSDKKILKQYLDIIRLAAKGQISDNLEFTQAANNLLELLFENPYIKEPIIPLSFIESELGRFIINFKYTGMLNLDKTKNVYSVKDVAEITKKTVQAIYKDINKKIHPIGPNNNNFYESEVKKYLKLKKVPLDNLYKFNNENQIEK